MFAVAALLAATLVAPAPAGPMQAAVTDIHELGVVGVQGMARIDGRTTRARAGSAELGTRTPVPLDGYFRMGSNTKTFTSVVVLQLVGEGKLSLDDTVEKRLPGVVQGNGNDGRRITVRQLLQHTSGLFNYTNDFPALASYDSYLAHRFDHYDAADLVAIAMKHPPTFAPGTSWDYSNTNYILAGMIVERATGRPWATEVRDRILRPLGLTHTSFPGDRASLPRPHAHVYQQWQPDGALTDTTLFNPTAAGAAGGMVTTSSDLTRFWSALQKGKLLKPRQMAEMHRTVLATTWQEDLPGARYGLGIQYLPNRCGGFWAHWGDVPGSKTANGVSADGKRVVALSMTTQLVDPAKSRAVDERVVRLIDDALCGPA
ncbi:serine hydrolase domain-containing protein [Paractinoplanes lichenicola]|uniref:Beta-lactamase family protein n=1 Tax=Paractinoplanes lichenicola TaxID=2802976 RepID=A0ABS1VUF2_9ACTN|nr:serine hydrolase domain-containing protein [Actinoplanes lichenicola]MBL7258116.1 beta-lactamase family protein [Actinoplanes lichenicola]